MKRLLWMGCLAYLLIGFTHVVIGAVLPNLIQHYGKGYEQGGVLVFIQFAGFLAGVLTVSFWTKRMGRKHFLAVMFFCLAAAEGIMVLLPPWPGAIAATLVAGYSFGSVETATGTLILLAFRDRQAVAMSKLEVFFGLGALLMPFFAGMLIRVELWRYSFLLLAASALLLAVLWLTLPFGEMDAALSRQRSIPSDAHGAEASRATDDNAIQPTPAGAFSKRKILAAFMAFFFIYVGTEVCIAEFSPSFFKEAFGTSGDTSAFTVTMFWSAMVIGRVFSGYIAEAFGARRYVLISSFATFVCLSVLAFVPSVIGAFALMLLLGLAMSGIFSVALIYANERLPGETERITSRMIAASGLGGALFPLLAGRTLAALPVRLTFGLLAIVTLLMFILMILQLFSRSSHSISVHKEQAESNV